MCQHSEPLVPEPIEEVRAVPTLNPQPARGNTPFDGDNLDVLREYICDGVCAACARTGQVMQLL